MRFSCCYNRLQCHRPTRGSSSHLPLQSPCYECKCWLHTSLLSLQEEPHGLGCVMLHMDFMDELLLSSVMSILLGLTLTVHRRLGWDRLRGRWRECSNIVDWLTTFKWKRYINCISKEKINIDQTFLRCPCLRLNLRSTWSGELKMSIFQDFGKGIFPK